MNYSAERQQGKEDGQSRSGWRDVTQFLDEEFGYAEERQDAYDDQYGYWYGYEDGLEEKWSGAVTGGFADFMVLLQAHQTETACDAYKRGFADGLAASSERSDEHRDDTDKDDEEYQPTRTGSGGGGNIAAAGRSRSTYDWRSIDTVIVNVQCVGCDQMEGHYFQYPGIRACKLCGYSVDLDRDWAEAIQGMIDSGLYMRVGDGRTLIMEQDWASAVYLNSFPKLKRLWDLTRFDTPVGPDEPIIDKSWLVKLLKIALILAVLWIAAAIGSNVWDWLTDDPPPAQVVTQSPQSVVAPEPATPEIPKVIIERAWVAEALDADGNGIEVSSTFPVNHRYGSDVREHLAFGIVYTGLKPDATQIKIEVWRPDARFSSGRCIPHDRSLRETTNGSGYALRQAAGTFSCNFQGYMLGPSTYEARVFADEAVVHTMNFTISERQSQNPYVGYKDSPPTADQQYWNDINRNQGKYKDSPQKSANKNAVGEQPAASSKVLCILPDASEKTTDAQTCRNVLGGVPYK